MLDKTKRYLVVGIGLLGGKYALELSKAGFHVDGINRSEGHLQFALDHGYIERGKTHDFEDLVREADHIIFGLYPTALIEWFRTYGPLLKPGCIFTDVSGVKTIPASIIVCTIGISAAVGMTNKHPATAIILGTGLGSLANEITEKYEISYSDIPNFPVSTVEGHSGKLIFGKLGNKDIIAMQGRFHYYEGYSMKEVTFPVRVMRELGIKTLFVSNASGGTNADFEIGDLMIITDHINYFPEHPLRGKNIPYGPRFPDMSEAYSKELIRKADEIAKEKGIKVQHGVYIGTQGPTFETPAEYKLFHILGADAVGMSTVPEVIVANHCGIKVFGISVITDLGVEGKIVEVTHEEVQKAADAAQPKMTTIMRELINRA